jgi:dTDP-4-dehydrorhamnose reductase
MNSHLVIGSAGLIGEHLMKTGISQGINVAGVDFNNKKQNEFIDIRQNESVVTSLYKLMPEVIYLTAAIPNVDYCEINPEETYHTNVEGVCNVVKAANKIGAKLIFFSSDYIFDGKAGPYGEDDPPNPINEYGRQKLIAEQYMAFHSNNYLIIRTTGVYGCEYHGKNFIYRLVKTLQNKQSIKVPIDQMGTPTYAPNLAKAVMELALKDIVGVYHIVGPDRINRYDFACEAARIFKLDNKLIQSTETSALKQPAKRPLLAGMKIDKVKSFLSIPLMGCKEGLRLMAANFSLE